MTNEIGNEFYIKERLHDYAIKTQFYEIYVNILILKFSNAYWDVIFKEMFLASRLLRRQRLDI